MELTEEQLELILRAVSSYHCRDNEKQDMQAILYEIYLVFAQNEAIALIMEICQRRIEVGIQMGRPKKKFDFYRIKELREQGMNWTQVANTVGVHRNTLVRKKE